MREELTTYRILFMRNYGIFTEEQQEKIRNTKILIVGCGGVGGASAIELARSGAEDLTLVDPDVYERSNVNRQICCFTDTIGKTKVEMIKEVISRINPEASVKTYTEKLTLEELRPIVEKSDVVLAVADDLAYSTHILSLSQELGKRAITALPYGFGGWVSVFTPNTPSIFDVSGTPEVPYEELKEIYEDRMYRTCGFFGWYFSDGKWRASWFRSFAEGELPLAQICPTVWLVASLATLEALKMITGKGEVVKAPKKWEIRAADPSINVGRFSLIGKYWWRLAYWVTNIKWMDLGQRLHKIGVKFYLWRLSRQEKRE